jgi:hypothetical protein
MWASFRSLRRTLRARLDELLHRTRHPGPHRVHRRRFEVLAGPGCAGFRGGVFNPGAVRAPDGSVVMVFKGQQRHWREALIADRRVFMVGAPVVARLARPSGPFTRQPHILAMEGFGDAAARAEDFRMFRVGDRVLVNHTITDFEPDRVDRQVLSELTDDRLRLLGRPELDFATKPREKNWIYTARGSDLLLFYSADPFRVLRLADPETLRFETVAEGPSPRGLSDPGALGARVSFSTNPVPWDDEHWFLLVHQFDQRPRQRHYRHWGVLVSRATLRPTHRTCAPLFDGFAARGRLRGVLYVTSVVAEGAGFVFLSGEGDSIVSRSLRARADIDRCWETLD